MSTAPAALPKPPVPSPLPSWAVGLEHVDAAELLHAVEAQLGARAAVATSFGAEDVVLLDLVARHAPSLRVFTLDTGRLHPQTYEVMEAVRARLGLRIETFFPDATAVEQLTRDKGFFSMRNSLEERKECCAVRKVEPLRRALAGSAAWVTGLRATQSVTRVDARAVEWDAVHGILKFNPLRAWSRDEVWAHIRAQRLPYNALHDVGFVSIGCAPCTRAIKPYEEERAGRWWWEDPEHKECGLHARS